MIMLIAGAIGASVVWLLIVLSFVKRGDETCACDDVGGTCVPGEECECWVGEHL